MKFRQETGYKRYLLIVSRLWLLQITILSFTTSSIAQADKKGPDNARKQVTPVVRTYRVPFDSVTRMFPPGTDLESIRFEELDEIQKSLLAISRRSHLPMKFMGSVIHELELQDGKLYGVSRFESSIVDNTSQAFRFIPDWLDSEFLAGTGWKHSGSTLYVSDDGQIALDFSKNAPIIKWSVPSLETGGLLRFPVRFPKGVVSGIRLKLTSSAIPSSDVGVWIPEPESNSNAAIRNWHHSGDFSPSEIRIEVKSTDTALTKDNFDADSLTDWTVNEEVWSGHFEATLRSAYSIPQFRASYPEEVFITGCQVNGKHTPFQRIDNELIVQINSEAGKPVTLRIEMKRAASHEQEVIWPTLHPLNGRWFLAKATFLDLRDEPFTKAYDANGVPIPLSIDLDKDQAPGALRLHFTAPGNESIVKLKAISSGSSHAVEMTGEYLLRESSSFASIRINHTKNEKPLENKIRIKTSMRPILIQAYRFSESGQKTSSDFELETSDDGFSLSGIHSDTTREPLIFEILLSHDTRRTDKLESIAFPAVILESGRTLNSKWSILSDEPRMRLKVQSAKFIRWLPTRSKSMPAESTGLKEIAPNAKAIAAWTVEGDYAPEFVVERQAVRSAEKSDKPLICVIFDRRSQLFHSIRFENDKSKSINARILMDETLEQALSQVFDNADFLRIGIDPGDRWPLSYIYETFKPDDSKKWLQNQVANSQGSALAILFASEKGPVFDKLFERFAIEDSDMAGFATVAEASIEYLKSKRCLKSQFGSTGINAYLANDPKDIDDFAIAFLSSFENVNRFEEVSPILTDQIELISDIATDGSATHILKTNLFTTDNNVVRLLPDSGCRILSASLDGIPVSLERNASAEDGSIFIICSQGLLELRFSTEAGILERSGFPMRISFADVWSVWKIRSSNDLWSIDDHSSPRVILRSSLENLGSHRIVKVKRGSYGFAVRTFVISICIWSILSLVIWKYSELSSRARLWIYTNAALSCTAILLQQILPFSVLAGAVFCIGTIHLRNRKPLSPYVRNALVLITTIIIASPIAAQPFTLQSIVRVAIPYESIENVFETPKRAILARTDLNNLRNLIAEFRREPVTTELFSNQASHTIESTEDNALRIVSKYRVASNETDEVRQSNKNVVVHLASDDALQIRAFLDEIEVPVRVDRNAGKVELRFDRPPTGELTVIKTFLTPKSGTGLKLAIFPAIGATIKNSITAKPVDGHRIQARIGNRVLELHADSVLSFDLANELMLTFESSNDIAESTNEMSSWFTVVRNSNGFVISVRVNDESLSTRTVTFGKSTHFLDASDCELTILPSSSESQSRIRVQPLRRSIRIRFWVPKQEMDLTLGDILNLSPYPNGAKSIIRLATDSDVIGDWSMLSDSKRIEEDPFEIESAASELQATIRGSFEVSDWRKALLQFRQQNLSLKPKIESIFTLEDKEVRGRFVLQVPCHAGSSIIRDTLVSFDSETVITEVTGVSLISVLPVNGNQSARRISFHGGDDGIARFEIKTRTAITPNQSVDSLSTESRSLLPWPRFDTNPLEPGSLIVDRRIDPDSSFRMSPIRSDKTLFENRGEIRTPETAADLRRWLYRFQGSEAPPVIGWQIPGVFSHVQVEHEIAVVRDVPQWLCRIHYDPMDGPLSTILLDVNHGIDFDPIIESDEPKSWNVEKLHEPGKSRFRLSAKEPKFGRSSIILRNGIAAHVTNRFDLPNVAPLGHGKVDKSVTLKTSSENQFIPFEVVARGLVESNSKNPGPVSRYFSRNWRFRASDASFSLIFGNMAGQGDFAHETQSNVRKDSIRNLVFELTDDGDVLWHATGDAAQMRAQGLPFPEEFGPIRIFGQDGRPLLLDRKDHIVVISKSVSFPIGSEVLITGRVRIDRLPLLLEAAKNQSMTAVSNDILFAMKNFNRSEAILPGKPATLIDWLNCGKSVDNANPSLPYDELELERIRKFQGSGFIVANANIPIATEAHVTASNRFRPTSNLSAGFATQFIDGRLLNDPARWKFYRLDPELLREFVRTEIDGGPKLSDSEYALRKGMIAFGLTIAVLLSSYARIGRNYCDPEGSSGIIRDGRTS